MKIKPQKKSHRTLYIIIVVLLLAFAAVTIWYYFFYRTNHSADTPGVRPPNSVSYTAPTQADKAANAQQKQDSIDQSKQDSTTTTAMSISISRVNQEGASGPVDVRSVVTGTTSATCYATFTNGTTSFNITFPVTQQATYSSCNTDVPASSFASSGQWTVNLYVGSGTSKSTTVTSEPFTVTR